GQTATCPGPLLKRIKWLRRLDHLEALEHEDAILTRGTPMAWAGVVAQDPYLRTSIRFGMHMARSLGRPLSSRHSPREYSVISRSHVVPEGSIDLQMFLCTIQPDTLNRSCLLLSGAMWFHQTIYTSEIW